MRVCEPWRSFWKSPCYRAVFSISYSWSLINGCKCMGQSTNTCWMFLTYLVQGQLAMSRWILSYGLYQSICTYADTGPLCEDYDTSEHNPFTLFSLYGCWQPPLYPVWKFQLKQKCTATIPSILPCLCHSSCLSLHLAKGPSNAHRFPLHVSTCVPNIAVLKVIPCGGWRTKEEAPSHSPNEIFPRFWWSASGAAIALEACPHWALALDQGELSSAT